MNHKNRLISVVFKTFALFLLLLAISSASEPSAGNNDVITCIPTLISNTTLEQTNINPELFAAEAFIDHYKSFVDIGDATFLESTS